MSAAAVRSLTQLEGAVLVDQTFGEIDIRLAVRSVDGFQVGTENGSVGLPLDGEGDVLGTGTEVGAVPFEVT